MARSLGLRPRAFAAVSVGSNHELYSLMFAQRQRIAVCSRRLPLSPVTDLVLEEEDVTNLVDSRRPKGYEPPKIKAFLDKVIQSPLQDIVIPLSGFCWEYAKGNFHHRRSLFLYFETYFMTYLSFRSDLLFDR